MKGAHELIDGSPRIAVVLGGGGMKGFAHIGVLRALEERGISPSLYAGTSIGALLAAATVAGHTSNDLAVRARSLRRRDVFRLNHFGMLLDRMRATSIYLEEPLRDLCRAVVPDVSFREMPLPLLVNTVDLDRGAQVVWGLPGLQDVSVTDAVYASCALPGFFPPGKVSDRTCVDGGVIDNLPAQIASLNADLVIAVDVGSSELSEAKDSADQGFAAIYMRAATVMMRTLQGFPLSRWNGPPMIFIRPKLTQDWLSFEGTASTIEAGYVAASRALGNWESYLQHHGGTFPRKALDLNVDREKCIGCGTCVALAPHLMGLDRKGKAFARTHRVEWSRADGEFIAQCPTGAISVSPAHVKDRRSGAQRASASVAKDAVPAATDAEPLENTGS